MLSIYLPPPVHCHCNDNRTFYQGFPKVGGEERSIFVLHTPLRSFISKASFKYTSYTYLARTLASHLSGEEPTTEHFIKALLWWGLRGGEGGRRVRYFRTSHHFENLHTQARHSPYTYLPPSVHWHRITIGIKRRQNVSPIPNIDILEVIPVEIFLDLSRGPFLERPGNFKSFLINLYLKTEMCIRLKFLVWREPLYKTALICNHN